MWNTLIFQEFWDLGTILAAPEVLFKGWGGWNVGDTAFFDVEDGGPVWVVAGTNGESQIRAEGAYHEAWRGIDQTAAGAWAGFGPAGAGIGERSEMVETTPPRPRRGAEAGAGAAGASLLRVRKVNARCPRRKPLDSTF